MKSVNKLFGIAAAAMIVALSFMSPQPAQAGSFSNYLTNKELDYFLRQQSFTAPTTVYVALATSSGSAAACGTEVAYTGYARVAYTSSLAQWSGTQGATTTVASSGTSGTVSNNATITFGAPTSGPNTVVEFCIFDASSGGNLLFRAALTTSKSINNGDAAPSFAISALTLTLN